jgi:hypothetical protein
VKDEHSALFRIIFALALIGALFAYAYFFYQPLRTQVLAGYREYLALEKEKDDIAEIMLDPGPISERITDLQGKLLETHPIKDLTPAGVVDNISQSIDKLDLTLQSVVLGVPEAPGGAAADAAQLLSMPVTIYMKAPYDGGMYFIGSLEKSETATYKIGEFSFKLAEEPRPESAADEAGDENDRETGAADGENPYPIFDWTITAYLLYYAEP